MRDYLALTKPRITWLILMSTGIGYFFGVQGAWNWMGLFHTILGTALICSGTAALNQWYERDSDAKMHRTQWRPLPSGKMTPANAFIFAVIISLAGFTELTFGVNLLTGLLGLYTLLSYLLIYTPLKRRTPHSTTIGAIPGALPTLIGFAAARGAITAEAWILFLILFLWQFPHFYAIAWMYREDYQRAGIRMLPVLDRDGEATAWHIMLFLVALVPVSLLPKFFAMTGNWYAGGALILGAVFIYTGIRITQDCTRQRARQVLLASVIYLPVLYGLMLLDRA
ncbi:MAG TPA: heme o synthase [Bryobacteraceae bacterium]|jgi:protoheme IX farnesyltransferase|nr:heme o synthase [Bryobacteraceae bacterium]HVW09520.1 heme o synthase [Bryobacteraceae bacterium]